MVDSLLRCHHLVVGLVNLESDGVGDRLGLGHRRADARIVHAHLGDSLASLVEPPFQFDKAQAQVGVAAWAGLLEVVGIALGHDSWSKIGLRDARAFLRYLHGLAGNLELATIADGLLQAVGKAHGKRWYVGRVDDGGGCADIETDGQIKSRDRHGFRFLGDIDRPLSLSQGDFGAGLSRAR